MVRTFTTRLVAFALVVGGLAATAAADDIDLVAARQFASWQQRVERLEARLARYERQDDVDFAASDESFDEPQTDWACLTPGLTAQAELLFLRAYNSDPDFDSDTDSGRFKECVRLTMGWTMQNGIGIRGRWFEYDLNTTDSNFLLQVVDLEATSRIDLDRDWYLRVSGGGRYAEYTEHGEENRLKGSLGPVMTLELGRAISDNISLFASGRQALVFGRDFINNDLAVIASEIQLGADVHYNWSGTTTLYSRIAWEGQFWTGMATEDAETFGLTGLALSVGLTR